MRRFVTLETATSILSIFFVWKPGLLTLSLYLPTDSSGKEKSPVSLVVKFCIAPVAGLVSWTATFAMTAPWLSVTVPERVPRKVWAKPGNAMSRATTNGRYLCQRRGMRRAPVRLVEWGAFLGAVIREPKRT